MRGPPHLPPHPPAMLLFWRHSFGAARAPHSVQGFPTACRLDYNTTICLRRRLPACLTPRLMLPLFSDYSRLLQAGPQHHLHRPRRRRGRRHDRLCSGGVPARRALHPGGVSSAGAGLGWGVAGSVGAMGTAGSGGIPARPAPHSGQPGQRWGGGGGWLAAPCGACRGRSCGSPGASLGGRALPCRALP